MSQRGDTPTRASSRGSNGLPRGKVVCRPLIKLGRVVKPTLEPWRPNQATDKALSLPPLAHCGRSQLDFHAEGLQDGEHLANLARRLPLLHLDDEPQTRAGGHRQLPLGHPHALAGSPDQLADAFRCMLHVTER